MVCNHCGSESHRTDHRDCPNYCTLCKEPGHRQKSNECKFRVCSKCGASGHSASECKQTKCSECGSTTHKSAMSFACPEHKCTNCQGTLEPKGPNRNGCPRMESAIYATNAVKPATVRTNVRARYATNAAKPATAQTNAQFVHAMHVAFEITNYKPAICVPNTCALCVTARKNQKVTTTLYAHVLSAKHASFSAMWRKTAHTQIVWTSRTIGSTFCSPNAKAS